MGIYFRSPPPHPHPPFSPSLISLMVSVDVKHHVYSLTYWNTLHTTQTPQTGYAASSLQCPLDPSTSGGTCFYFKRGHVPNGLVTRNVL